MQMEATWFNVNDDARIWAGHSDAHKQGWLYAPGAILAIEEYKGSYRFEEWKVENTGSGAFAGGSLAPNLSYPEMWVRIKDVSLIPFEDEDDVSDDMDTDPGDEPDPAGRNARLGAAIRLIRAEGGGVVFPASE